MFINIFKMENFSFKFGIIKQSNFNIYINFPLNYQGQKMTDVIFLKILYRYQDLNLYLISSF